MRRQFTRRVAPLSAAAAVMVLGAASVHAESARADAALEIVGSVGTTAIADAFEKIELGLSKLPPPALTRTLTGPALRRDMRVGSGEPGYIASISTVEAPNPAIAGDPACTAPPRETCNNVVVAQYN